LFFVTTMEEESRVRMAAEGLLDAWTAVGNNNDTVVDDTPFLHPACSVLVLSSSSSDDGEKGYQIVAGRRHSVPKQPEGAVFQSPLPTTVKSVKILDVGSRSAASVHIGHAVSAASSSSGQQLHGWLVFLLEDGHHHQGDWKCISAALSSTKAAKQIQPADVIKVVDLTWNGYRQANRDCDGTAMARAFHETCRLTYVLNGRVEIIDQITFCNKVANRYKQEEAHRPYAHLQNDPCGAVGRQDSLLAVEFAASGDVAMVTLRVGHPPFLWTDLLTCAKIQGQWWICHKSSCNEPFLL
jgi:hypothetical protein